MAVTTCPLTALQAAFWLGAQGPPADLLRFTKLTLPFSGTKWAPGSLSPPYLYCSACQVAAQTVFGATVASGQIPLQFLGILYQNKVLDHSCSCQWRSPTQKGHHQATCSCKPSTNAAGKFRSSPCLLLPWTQSVTIPSLLCASVSPLYGNNCSKQPCLHFL